MTDIREDKWNSDEELEGWWGWYAERQSPAETARAAREHLRLSEINDCEGGRGRCAG